MNDARVRAAESSARAPRLGVLAVGLLLVVLSAPLPGVTAQGTGGDGLLAQAGLDPECMLDTPDPDRITPVSPDQPLDPAVYAAHYGPPDVARDLSLALNAGPCAQNTTFTYAAAARDVTGPAHDQGMAGYADTSQTSMGVQDRQWSRAFVLASTCSGIQERVALVIVDQGLMFASVRQEVLAALEANSSTAGVYGDDNLVLTATHSHATAAGQAHHDLYNITAAGFDEQAFDALVGGIVASILEADAALTNASPGALRFDQGELLNTNVQRSAPAYDLNPPEWRSRFVDVAGDEVRTNRNVVAVDLVRDDGTDVGLMSWYPLHGTTLAQTNRLLSGDNKGAGARLVEERHGVADRTGPGPVAGFFQADQGDNSPNLLIPTLSEAELRDLESPGFVARGGGVDEQQSLRISGLAQANRLQDLTDGAGRPLVGGIASIGTYIDFSAVEITDPRPVASVYETDAADGIRRTCLPALGVAFAGGAEDGRGPSAEGQTCEGYTERDAERAAELIVNALETGGQGTLPPQIVVPVGCDNLVYDALGYDCHAEKPIVFPLDTSPFDPTQGLAARSHLLQIMVLGDLAVASTPWEITTTSGRRIREALIDVLAPAGVNHVVLNGLANNYAHYLTTREEYASQQYEGGATIFGPWSQEAVEQELVRLAEDLVAGRAPTSPHVIERPVTRVTSFVHQPDTSDGFPVGTPPAGTVVAEPPERIDLGGQDRQVTAMFVAGNPRNDLRTDATYLLVEQQQADGSWLPVLDDHDGTTSFTYMPRQDNGTGLAVVTWQVPACTPDGVFRLRHLGATNTGPYEGLSRSFVLAQAAATTPGGGSSDGTAGGAPAAGGSATSTSGGSSGTPMPATGGAGLLLGLLAIATAAAIRSR